MENYNEPKEVSLLLIDPRKLYFDGKPLCQDLTLPCYPVNRPLILGTDLPVPDTKPVEGINYIKLHLEYEAAIEKIVTMYENKLSAVRDVVESL
jgi:hypothetical protein